MDKDGFGHGDPYRMTSVAFILSTLADAQLITHEDELHPSIHVGLITAQVTFVHYKTAYSMSMEEQEHEQKNERDADRYPAPRSDRPLRDVRDVFDRMFDERMWLEPLEFLRAPRLFSRFDRIFFPRVDISETESDIIVVADVPGVDPDDINIDVREHRMSISGKTERQKESGEGKPYSYERTYGTFRREFTLPARVKEDQVKAVCKDGILTITMQKEEPEKRNRIAIEKA